MRKAALLTIVALVALSGAIAGCGGGGGGSKSQPEMNFATREAITEALAADKSLDAEARAVIASVKAGATPLPDGLNSLVGETTTVLELIRRVTAAPKPSNTHLVQAQTAMEDYLRKREFQLEQAMVASSAAEAEAAYAASQPSVDAARQQVRESLLSYDPGLEKTLP